MIESWTSAIGAVPAPYLSVLLYFDTLAFPVEVGLCRKVTKTKLCHPPIRKLKPDAFIELRKVSAFDRVLRPLK